MGHFAPIMLRVLYPHQSTLLLLSHTLNDYDWICVGGTVLSLAVRAMFSTFSMTDDVTRTTRKEARLTIIPRHALPKKISLFSQKISLAPLKFMKPSIL